MATVVGDLLVKLSASDSELTATLASAGQKMQAFGDKMKAVGQSMSMFVTAPMVLAGGASIKLASDFNESIGKINVVFKENAKEVENWSKTTLKSFGIAQGSALDMVSLFGDMGTSMGLTTKEAAAMGKELVGRAGDLASFKNIGLDEAANALKGIFTGEGESLKTLGYVMLDSTLAAYALANGFKTQYKDMSQAEKVALRYKYIMEQSGNAQGDFTRTSAGAANQSRIFGEQMKELGVSFGQIILPLFTKIITAVNGWIEKFKNLDEGTKKIIVVVLAVVAAIGPLMIILGVLTSTVIPALVAGGAAIAAAWLPVTLAITAAYAAFKLWEATTDKRFNDVIEQNTKVPIEALQKAIANDRAKLKAILEKEGDPNWLERQWESIKKGTRDIRSDLGFRTEKEAILENLYVWGESIRIIEERKKVSDATTPVIVENEGKVVVATEKVIGTINELNAEIAKTEKLRASAYGTEKIDKYDRKLQALKNKLEDINDVPDLSKKVSGDIEKPSGKPYTGTVSVGSFGPQSSNIDQMRTDLAEAEAAAAETNKNIKEDAITTTLDIGEAMSNLATGAAVTLGESIGNALAGGGGLQDVLDGMLTMLADWAAQFGQTLIAAGTAVLVAKNSLAANPALAIGAGIVLVAAAAAVKASASKPVAGGGSRGSGGSGPSGGGGSLEGFRTMREDFVVNVNGTLTGKGKDLVAVLATEGTRKGL